MCSGNVMAVTPHVQWMQPCRSPVVLPRRSSNVCWKSLRNRASSSSLFFSICISIKFSVDLSALHIEKSDDR